MTRTVYEALSTSGGNILFSSKMVSKSYADKYYASFPEIVSPYTADTPTIAELKTAIMKHPKYINAVQFYGINHNFYLIKSASESKMLSVRYRGNSTNLNDTSVGEFFFAVVNKAV